MLRGECEFSVASKQDDLWSSVDNIHFLWTIYPMGKYLELQLELGFVLRCWPFCLLKLFLPGFFHNNLVVIDNRSYY